jgi:two-component system, NarL family, invasion response regulator UvrY
MESRAQRVVLVDDHPVLRRGMAEMVEEMGWSVEAQCATLDEARQVMLDDGWTVAVVDLHLPDGTGFDLLEWMRENGCGNRPVLVHSVMPDAAAAARVFKLGGNGFLNKGAAYGEFQTATRKVADGGRYVSAEFADVLADALANGPALHDTLSEREYAVMMLIAEGKTPGQVAAELNINVNTLSTYRARILKKLNLTTSMDIVQYAIRNKLVLL